jgi:hypothetical protein
VNWWEFSENRREDKIWKIPSMLCRTWCLLLQSVFDLAPIACKSGLGLVQSFESWIIRFSFQMWGFEEWRNSWRARILWNEHKGSLFIAKWNVICTLGILSNFSNAMFMLAWACEAHDAMQLCPKSIVLRFESSLNDKARLCDHLKIWFCQLMQAC